MSPANRLVDNMEMFSDFAEGVLERAANPKSTYCQWCKHPDKRVRRAGLCNHCYRLKLEVNRRERELNRYRPHTDSRKDDVDRYMLERELKVARQMVELAKHEGEFYSRFAEPASGLEVEEEMSFISTRWLGKNLFFGWANTIDRSFDQTQKRLLLYMFRKMMVEYLRDNRRNIADGIVFQEERDEGIA